MYNIIKDLFNTNRSHQIAFKGGTLAYFIYSLDRFSTDIDLDFLAWLPTEKQTNDIQHILKKHWEIKEFQKFHNMHRYIYSYGAWEHNIKVECNTRVRKANKYETINFFGSPIQAMDTSSMFANKLVALIDRDKPTSRDLRDIHFFFSQKFPINDAIIHERMDMDSVRFFEKLKTYISENYKSKHVVDANLGIVLSSKQKAWAKKSLITEVINRLDFLIFELNQ